MSAVATQVLLLPFKHVLPNMIANANTGTTNTHLGVGLFKRQMNKFQQVMCCGAARKKLWHKKDVQVAALDKWMALLAANVAATRNVEDEFKVARSSTATSLEVRQKSMRSLHRQMTQRLRKQYLKSHLFLFKWRIKLPDISGKKKSEMQLSAEQVRRMKLDRVDGEVVGQVGRRQKGVREWLRERKLIRQEEFTAWYGGMKRARHVLAGLAAFQLLYILAVGLAVCLAFSYAFTEEECWAWLAAVGKSVLMQLFVTDPVLGMVMLVSKLLMGWLLLRCEIRAQRKRRLSMLDERERSLELTELKSVGDVKVVRCKGGRIESGCSGRRRDG